MATVKEQSKVFLAQLRDRRRNPVKLATLRAYESSLKARIIPRLGKLPIEAVENGVMKDFVSYLVRKKFSPATIQLTLTTLKALVSSDTDENGNERHPRKWNADFIDAPRVILDEQDAPIMTSQGVSEALRRATGVYRPLYALLAATGLRFSEAVALRMGPDDKTSSIWDPEAGIVFVRKAIYNHSEQGTKTVSGVREIDVYRDLTAYLRKKFTSTPGEYLFKSSTGTLMHSKTAYTRMQLDGIPGFHSLRRFRATYLDSMGCASSLISYWMGHKRGTITDKYIKVGKGLALRRGWCERAGLGFELPKEEEDESEMQVAVDEPVSTASLGSESNLRSLREDSQSIGGVEDVSFDLAAEI